MEKAELVAELEAARNEAKLAAQTLRNSQADLKTREADLILQAEMN